MQAGRSVLTYAGFVTAADYSDLHELIDRLEPEQAEELREHVLRLIHPVRSRFKVLRTFSGPEANLGVRAREVMRADFERDDADR